MTPDDAVARLARTPRLLVALDFDGTLAPFVDDPMTARMLPEARAAVEAIAAAPATTVALVSGRTIRDLRIIAEHGDDSPLLLAGSHGAQEWPAAASDDGADAEERPFIETVTERAESLAASLDGAWIEPKEFGFALHTRLVTDAAGAKGLETAVDTLVSEAAPGWRRRVGRDILEFSSRHDGKDAAVARLRERTDATAVLFAGDDVTDEDALRSLRPGDLGVRVGAGETAASVRVADIPELAALLVRLAHGRAPEPE